MRVLIINGPNLDLLGTRETKIYGEMTLDEIEEAIREEAAVCGLEVDFYQSNSEGSIIDRINTADAYDALIINPGAYTHYSIAIRDSMASYTKPIVEVHMSNIHAREEAFRKVSITGEKAKGIIGGFGYLSYVIAIEYLRRIIDKR